MSKQETLKHSDCMNFTNIDAAKGICRFHGEKVFIDTPVCKAYETAPKCKNCNCFTATEQPGMGNCSGLTRDSWTYEELSAVTCEGYAKAE